MSRQEKRQQERLIENIKRKAVKDMSAWVLTLTHAPTENEVKAYQAGYIDGINRQGNLDANK